MKKAILIIFLIMIIAIFYWLRVQVEPKKPLSIPYHPIQMVKRTPSYMERMKEKEGTVTHVAIGDSVVVGWGSFDHETSYIEYLDGMLEEELKNEVKTINKGVNALTSNGLVERLERKSYKNAIKEADVISINIGGNDILERAIIEGEEETIESFEEIRKNYQENIQMILRKVREVNPDALIVINELYNALELNTKESIVTNFMLIKWNGVVYNETEDIHPKVILPLSKYMKRSDDIWYEDRVHPNDEGYKKMAALWIDELKHTYKK